MPYKRGWLLSAAVTITGLATGALANGSSEKSTAALESVVAIRSAAEAAVRLYYTAPGSRIVVSAGALNSRIALPACLRPLLATVPKRASPASRLSVPVQCPGNGGSNGSSNTGWLVRVPISLHLFRSVLVTSRPLQRGDGLQLSDLHSEERDITALGYGVINDLPNALAEARGRTLARPLGAGHVLTPNDLGGRRMVLAGDRVQVVAQLEGIEVSTGGIALGGGDNGARLRVRNQSSGRIIDAMIIGPGQVSALP